MKSLFTSNLTINKDRDFTYLLVDASAGITTLSVQSINAFTTNQILLIGELGQEESEIKYTHLTVSPASSSLYISAGLTFAHPQDTKIYIIPWDGVEFSRAATASGAKTTLNVSKTIQVDKPETQWDDFTYSSGFYFSRLRDSLNTRYSDYSDPVPYAGYDDGSVFSIKERALESVGEEISDIISHDFLNKKLWEARREFHKAPGKRPFRKKLNTDIGNVSTGMYKIAVPSDLEKPYTAENVYKVQIGTNKPLGYWDKKEMDDYYRDVPHTTLKNAYATADVYLIVNDSRDFLPSGSVTMEQDNSVAYSANDVANGSLTISTAGSRAQATTGIDVWQNASYGLPTHFAVVQDADGTIYITFDRPLETLYLNQNIYADYYRTLVAYDSDADILDEPEPDMFTHYLSWSIKKKKNRGLSPIDDADYLLWQKKKADALSNEYLGAEVSFVPDIEHLG